MCCFGIRKYVDGVAADIAGAAAVAAVLYFETKCMYFQQKPHRYVCMCVYSYEYTIYAYFGFSTQAKQAAAQAKIVRTSRRKKKIFLYEPSKMNKKSNTVYILTTTILN